MSLAAIVTFALILDALLGEPKWLWSRAPHPAVLMGRLIGWADARFNSGDNRKARGGTLIAVLTVGASGLGFVVASLPAGALWSVLIGAILLAQRSLVTHVADVASALRLGVGDGRLMVARIVGRDVNALDGPGVTRSAIESAAENLSDGVIAPALWFLLLGLPGLLAYKIINTADSMIGYRTEKYADFGWAAARLDDAVNWVPARISAVLIMASYGRFDVWQIVWRDAHLHRSPNAGWPEAAMAGVLNVALSGPRSYGGEMRDEPFVHPAGKRDPGPQDIENAVGVLWRSWALGLGLLVVLSLAR